MKRLVARELMDDNESIGSASDWRTSLEDLAKVNALLGGTRVVISEVDRLAQPPLRLLDVATGYGDVPAALLDHLRARGVSAACVAVDRSARLLQLAAERSAGRADLEFVRADATALPFADASFDVATCNLALHHFEPGDAAAVLRELARVARTAIVNDLRRSVVAWLFASTVLRAFARSAFTRADGPVSVRRAYTMDEARALALRAGWARVAVRKYPWYRMALVGGRP